MAGFELAGDLEADIATGLFRRGEIVTGNFQLREGDWSPIYVDLRPTPSAIENNPQAPTMTRADQIYFRRRVVEAYSQMLDALEGGYEHVQAIPEAVCGIVPMVGFARDDSVLYRRVKLKKYGRPSDGILGDYHEGDRTVLLDDLVSTSGAKVAEKTLVEDISRTRTSEGLVVGAGLAVKCALILLDRETGGIQAAAGAGLMVHAGIKLSRALEINRHEGLLDERTYNIANAFIRGDLKRPEDVHLFE